MRHWPFAITVTSSVFAAGAALAEDTNGNASASAGSGSAVAQPPTSVETEAAASSVAPVAPIIADSLVLARGELGMIGGLGLTRQSQTILVFSGTNTTEGLVATVGYGITDQLTMGLQYELPIHDDSGAFPSAGVLDAMGAYEILRNDKLALAIGADVSLTFPEGSGGTTTTIDLGATLRYKLTPTVALFTGNPVAPGAVGQQFAVSTQSNGPIRLSLPVGVAWQPTPRLFTAAQTTLASFDFRSPATADFELADFISLQVGALYNVSPTMDVGGLLAFTDFEDASYRELDFMVSLRYRGRPLGRALAGRSDGPVVVGVPSTAAPQAL
jgi:hypothetical protein